MIPDAGVVSLIAQIPVVAALIWLVLRRDAQWFDFLHSEREARQSDADNLSQSMEKLTSTVNRLARVVVFLVRDNKNIPEEVVREIIRDD